MNQSINQSINITEFAQSGKLSNLCFLTGYRTFIGQRTFFVMGSSLEIPKVNTPRETPVDSPFKCENFS